MNKGQLFVVVGITAGAIGCTGGSTTDGSSGTSGSTSGSSGGSAGAVNPNVEGSIHLDLTLPGGESITNVAWVISGPNGLSSVLTSGTQTVNALALNFLVGSIPAASGYRITLSGSSPSGVTCTGGADFDVVARETTTVPVAMACSSAPSGSVGTLVNGQTYDCAALTGVSASPTTLSVGGSAMLLAMAAAPNPANLTYAWSAPSGSFSAPSSAFGSFQCTDPGSVPLTVVVADGTLPDGAVCNPATTTMTVMITCNAALSDGGSGSSGAGSSSGGSSSGGGSSSSGSSGAGSSGSGSSSGGSSSGGASGGGTDGGSLPPPTVPATPPWALAILCSALLALGLKRRRPDSI